MHLTPWLVILTVSGLRHTPAPAQDSARVEIIFLDVGQGDAVLIRSPEGRTALIDAGPRDIVPLLTSLGVDTIDLAIASHPHADHIGGMERVLRTFPVRFYLDNGVPHTTGTYRSLMRWVEQSGVTYLEATARTIGLGSVTLRILPPPRGPPLSPRRGAAANLNDQSVGVVVELGAFAALLTGDSERRELAHFMALGVPRVAVLKAPHHGSDNGVTREWLAATAPKVVVISCGAGNTYGHPHARALGLYQAAATVYRTDRNGTVTIRGARDGTLEVATHAR